MNNFKKKNHLNKDQSPQNASSFILGQKFPFQAKVQRDQQNNFQATISNILALKHNNQTHTALIKIDELIKSHPNIRSFQIKGQITYEMKQYEQSLKCYEKILQIINASENNQAFGEIIISRNKQKSKGQALYLFNKAICLQKLGRHSEAVTDLKQAIKRDKNNIDFALALSLSYKSLDCFDKMYKVYDKLMEKNPSNLELLLKIINSCQDQKDYRFMRIYINRGLQYLLQMSMQNQSKISYNKLIYIKADMLKATEDYAQAIQHYLQILNFIQQKQQKATIYKKISICYEHLKDINKALQFYNKVLQINPDDIDTMNNMGNLQIRRANYNISLQIFNNAILRCLISGNQAQNKLLLLKSHRMISFSKLGRFEQAGRDLTDIMESLKQKKYLQLQNDKDSNSYNFIKDVIKKYEKSINQINEIKNQAFNQEVNFVKLELLASISDELSQNNQQKNDRNMKNLLIKIDKMHEDIMNFKNKTLKEHEQQQNKIRCQIDKMQQTFTYKQEQIDKFKQQMALLKQQYSGVCSIVEKIIQNQQKKGQFSKLIQSLKQQNKQEVSIYVQQFYWIFNSYLILIKLTSNDLMTIPQSTIHLNKVSSFFSKFKNVFSTLSKITHIPTICDCINGLLTFYLNLQSNTIYKTLNMIITNHYCTQQEIQNGLQKALITLIKSQYIEENLVKNKCIKVNNQRKLYNRAYQWFKTQKNKILGNILQVQISENNDIKFIRQLIIQDISAILVYMVKNQDQFTHKYSKLILNNIFEHVFHKTLICGFKTDEITSLYSRESCKQSKSVIKAEGCPTCQIYVCQLPYQKWQINCNQNDVWNQLIEESIKQNNIPLFMHAINKINFEFI